MTLKQSNYRAITALLLILVIAVGAVWAPLYVEASTGHDCGGTACPVCLTISVGVSPAAISKTIKKGLTKLRQLLLAAHQAEKQREAEELLM